MSSLIDSKCYKLLIPLPFTPLRPRPAQLPFKTPLLASRCYKGKLQFNLVSSRPQSLVTTTRNHISAVAKAEPERLDRGRGKEEHKGIQLRKRIVFGLGIGLSGGAVVLAGGWIFTAAMTAATFFASREYFALVRSRDIAMGMTPPPPYLSSICSLICTVMPILTLYFGHIDRWVSFAAFLIVMTLLLQKKDPRFSQLSSTMFGLFYCGYFPCFWVKLRCGIAVPALNTKIAALWPQLLGGNAHWTVGLVTTLIAICGIIAADTFAFIGGKAFGRTPLTSISPKKTWEGVISGLCGCIAVSVLLSKVLCWPLSLPSIIAFAFLNFIGSLFGDLMESMMKREAGVKDSGSLIPGHGGILDRFDSYIFSGALSYSFVKTFLRLYGV